MEKFLKKLKNKENLSFEESKTAFEILMNGKASDDEILKFLTLLSSKGEASDEIAGGVFVLRNKSKRVSIENCIDTCGTGGDGKNTLNISTASAILLSSMGIKVAKHGNKAVSSKCGSGDVLEALNIEINLEPKEIEKQINKNNFGFMFAPKYHSAMKYVGPIRKKIGKRTDKATIYRALNAFEESGLIHQVPDQENLSRYALCDIKCSPSKHVHQHAHFICNDCSETFCIEQIQFPNTKKINNFKVQKIEITLQGTCPKC